jgi:hypothetical protein
VRLFAAAALALALAGGGSAEPPLELHVQGNHLVDGTGKTIRLLGVNRSSFEYACAEGWGFDEGPTDAASIDAMKTWRIDAVRVPLNEACWLGLSSVKKQWRGQGYRQAVLGYVARLHAAGLYVILDLHWSAPGSQPATHQQVMADADHSVAFWKSVAAALKNDPAVVFDLYNEPHDISWRCWRDGCTAGFETAGMQKLVTAIRSTGAKQPLMLGGLAWANDLSQWLRWKPSDPAKQLVASFHLYNFNACDTAACWNAGVAPVAASVPVVTGENGEDDCAHGFVDGYMNWADAHGISYLGWTWNPWDCSGGPALISDWNGTATAFGAGLHDHLAALR